MMKATIIYGGIHSDLLRLERIRRFMEIKFTKEQYENLMKLVYLGNWMINAIRTDDRVKKYDELKHYIFFFRQRCRAG